MENAHYTLLKGGYIVDNEQNTITQSDILIYKEHIIQIGKELSPIKDDTITLDCTNCIVAAGYVDAHVHIESSMVLPQAFGEAVLPHGTTTVIADPHEVVNVAGAEGLQEFIDEAGQAPISIFTVVPSCVPATPLDTNGAGCFLASDMKPFVNHHSVVGLGEVMCAPDVIKREPNIMEKIALFKHKTIDGHAPSADSILLDAYVNAGIQNDHETYDEASLMAHYDRGFNIYIREGSAARNGELLLQIIQEKKLDISRFAFCTDDKHLATISQEGHISYLVQLALRMGFNWCDVSRMASLNPCRFYHLEKRGNIREGYLADIVITDKEGKQVKAVIKEGKWVSSNQQMRQPTEVNPTRTFTNSLRYKELTAEDFFLPENKRHIAIELVNNQILTLKTKLASNEWEQLPIAATIERYGKNGNIALCPIKNYNIQGGAVATSVSHDAHNVVCIGTSPDDMALACNHLRSIGGGYVIVKSGKVAGVLPLPAYGLMAVTDAQTTSGCIQQVEQTVMEMGVNPHIDAFTTLSFIALPVIPSLRLLDTGLYDVENNCFL